MITDTACTEPLVILVWDTYTEPGYTRWKHVFTTKKNAPKIMRLIRKGKIK